MDQQRFDLLTRQIATAAPRRSVLRVAFAAAAGAVAAHWRGRTGLAQEGTLAPGAACTSASQCSQAGGYTACADNGYTDDGALNCCRPAGGACYDTEYSADCCSGLYCRDGVCTDLSVTGDLPPGSYCVNTSQCSQASGPTVCADNGLLEDGARNCCLMEGGYCGTLDARCCSGLICATDGRCRPVSGSTTPTPSDPNSGEVPLGGTCTSSSQCGGNAICADNGLASDGPLNCCLTEVSTCTSDVDCCAGLICGDNFIAEDGPLNCCAPLGGYCSSDAACCDFGYCIDGICQAATATQ